MSNKKIEIGFQSAVFHLCQWALVPLGAFACSRPKFWKRFRSRTLGRGEVPLLSSGWTLIGSELSSLNFNSSVRAVRSFTVRYLNVVIKPLCGNLDICLTTRLPPTFGRGILFACFSRALAQFSRSISVVKNPSTRMHLLMHNDRGLNATNARENPAKHFL